MGLPVLLLERSTVTLPAWLAAPGATAVIHGVAFASGPMDARCDAAESLVLLRSPSHQQVRLHSGWRLPGERPKAEVVTGVALLVAGSSRLGRSTELRRGLLRARGNRKMLLLAVLRGTGASVSRLGLPAGGRLRWVAGLLLVAGVPLLLASIQAGDPHRLATDPEGAPQELFTGPAGRQHPPVTARMHGTGSEHRPPERHRAPRRA